MATFQPPIEHFDEVSDPLTGGALEAARALSSLDDDWTVYARPQVGQDVPDFVAFHPVHGVTVVDVADTTPDRHLALARRHRGVVWEQVFSLPGDPIDPGDQVRGALVVPAVSTDEARRLVASAASGPIEPITVWGGDELRSRVDEMVGTSLVPPPTESLRRLRRQLVIGGVTHDLVTPVQLSYNARTVAANPKGTRIRGISGPAGSGKSFALTARAARLAGEGRQVLILSFNSTLAARLRQLVVQRCAEYGADPTRVTCTSFHNFCARLVDDAVASGIEIAEPERGTWPVKIVQKASAALDAGFDRHYDAVLVDEGQDFTLAWWNLLRQRLLRADGEMLLATDPAVDLYGNETWSEPATLEAAGFHDPWIQMPTSYRMAPELVESTNLFANRYLTDDESVPTVPGVADDQAEVVGFVSAGTRTWRNVGRVADLGREIGRAVVELLRTQPTLHPRDVVYLCEYHHDGLAAAAEIDAAGYAVHHVYSRDPDARHLRKARFWPEADAVKGCTVHSFKGWESPAVVLGIGVEARSRRLAYASMTRVASTHGLERSHLVVVNADRKLAEFQPAFELGAPIASPD